MQNNETNPTTSEPQTPSRAPFWIGVVAIAALAVTSGVLYQELKQVRGEVANLSAALFDQVNTVRETSAMDSGKNRRELETLRTELTQAIAKAQGSAGRAKTEAKRHAERLAAELAVKQEEQRTQIAQQISSIQDETATRLEQVSTDVGDVRATVATHGDTLNDMTSGLRTVRGDLGVMSGLIATNAEELEALRELGERNYFEFDISKPMSEPVRVSNDVRIELRHTDKGKNRFTMDVFADDQRISKKNRTVNEPIQFYVGGRGGLPYEIVVNEVERGRITGYLSTPKVDLLAKR